MTAVVPPVAARLTIDTLAGHGVDAMVVGEVVERAGVGDASYVEGALETIA